MTLESLRKITYSKERERESKIFSERVHIKSILISEFSRSILNLLFWKVVIFIDSRYQTKHNE